MLDNGRCERQPAGVLAVGARLAKAKRGIPEKQKMSDKSDILVEINQLISHTLNDILVKNSSGAFLASEVIICRKALSFEGKARIIIQIREDLFLDGYVV